MPSGGPALFAHRPQQIGPRRSERMPRLRGDGVRELADGGKRCPVFLDEPAQSAAVAEAVQRPGHQGEVDVRGRFVPGPKRAAGHVHLNAFRRGAEPGVLPVVDRAGAVGGQVRQPAAAHHAFKNAGGAVPQQVGAVDQQHRRATPPGPADRVGAVSHERPNALGALRGRGLRVEEDVVSPRQTLALGQGKHPQFAQVQRLHVHGFLRFAPAAATRIEVEPRAAGFPTYIAAAAFAVGPSAAAAGEGIDMMRPPGIVASALRRSSEFTPGFPCACNVVDALALVGPRPQEQCARRTSSLYSGPAEATETRGSLHPTEQTDMAKHKKVCSLEELQAAVARLRDEGRRVVHCHGVFDLLHIGHLRHFEQARKMGDVLMVTLTPDRHVNKGAGRPAFPEALRAEMIAALDCVDYVAVNRWPTAVETIHMLRPNAFAKGSEFRNLDDTIGHVAREKEAVASVGGEIVFTEDITFSSSALINRYMSQVPEPVKEWLTEFATRYPAEEVLRPLRRRREEGAGDRRDHHRRVRLLRGHRQVRQGAGAGNALPLHRPVRRRRAGLCQPPRLVLPERGRADLPRRGRRPRGLRAQGPQGERQPDLPVQEGFADDRQATLPGKIPVSKAL